MHWLKWMNLCVSKLKGGLGFKDFACFNDALLAKQGWRLVKYPNSIVSRLLQAKYFPAKTFLEANLGRNPSFMWRSIWGARKLLNKGLRWKVGNGATVNVRDRWLPKPTTFRLDFTNCQLDMDMKVRDLINWDNRSWKRDFLVSRVTEEDLDFILAIPVSLLPREDTLVWHYTNHGIYSVKTGYQLALEEKRSYMQYGESSNSGEAVWKIIWNLDIPPKVRLFLWRACREVLPVRANLVRRGLLVDPMCPVCGFQMENVLHSLTACPAAAVAWFMCPLGLHAEEVGGESFFHWFQSLCNKLNREQLCIVAMIAWGVWNGRNASIHGGGSTKPEDNVQFSLRLLGDFQRARENNANMGCGQSSASTRRWAAPPPGTLKINTDASVGKSGFVGIGFLIRDHYGKVIGAGIDRIMGNVGVECAEALAIRGGLKFALELSIDRLVIESDSKRVIDALHDTVTSRSSYLSDIVEDCLALVTNLREVSFNYVPRYCNVPAHILASMVQQVDVSVPRYWLDQTPDCISHAVVSDFLSNISPT